MTQEVRALLPQIAAAADDIEQARALPDALVASLKAAGAFRGLIPVALGGTGVRFEDWLGLVQDIATADASTAWCVNQAAVIGLTSLWLPHESAAAIWADPAASVANGPPFDCEIEPRVIEPRGNEPRESAWRLRGHWGFSSGCQHATHMMGAAKCTAGGYRIAYFRPADVQFDDNWQVAGLRGTGSFEFRVEDLVVADAWVADMAQPATHQFELTVIPNTLLFAMSFAAVALGVARGAMDDVLAIAQGKVPRFAAHALAKDPDVQRFTGKALARWRAARAYLHATANEVVGAVRANGEIAHAQRSELRLCGTQVIRECAEVVDLAYKIAGSTSIYQTATLQRRFQDMHVITQHVQARESYFALVGRHAITGDYEIGPMS